MSTARSWLSLAIKLRRQPCVEAVLGIPEREGCDAERLLAWGGTHHALLAERIAQWSGTPLRLLDDAFLRSFGEDNDSPALGLMADDWGIHYDSTRPSQLEALLQSDKNLLDHRKDALERALELIKQYRLTRFNHAPPLQDGTLLPDDRQRVLVVDQAREDPEVRLGAADESTFLAMLAAAQAENPQATVYIKAPTGARVLRRNGYLSKHRAGTDTTGQTTVVLREPVNPLDLLAQMDRVYVATSHMGFEALLMGKPVTCFGLPWYAGWGATDDRQRCPRRTKRRSVLELFAAAYVDYARYVNPEDHGRGSLEHVIRWLKHQRDEACRVHGPDMSRWVIGVNMSRWRQRNLRPMLGLQKKQVAFAPSVEKAKAMEPRPGDTLLCWGGTPPAGLAEMAREHWARLLHIEDGFIRSVGLGSDLIRPRSLVLDERGIYFDATRPSDLEHMLNTHVFSSEELTRAQEVRNFIVKHGITKYNLEPAQPVRWPDGKRHVVLVTGQVEGDASIRLGCTTVRTNLQLLNAVRQARPDSFIVYKPHPDVLSRNRNGRLALEQAMRYADHIEAGVSVISCIQACDELHTMTSQSGFDALLRGKRVVTYGQPFYAGWGLTEDLAQGAVAFERRKRKLKLDELVAGSLLLYPIYWDWELMGYTTCEAVLKHIVRQRTALQISGDLYQLQHGWIRRQFRRFGVVTRAWVGAK